MSGQSLHTVRYPTTAVPALQGVQETSDILYIDKVRHDPKNFRQYERPTRYKRSHPFRAEAKARIRRETANPDFSACAWGTLAFHADKFTKSNALRKVRSERRENHGRLGECLVDFSHHSGRLGYPVGSGKWHDYSWEFFADKINASYDVTLKTKDDFIAKGYLVQKENKIKLNNGTWKALPPTLFLTPLFFLSLGYTDLEIDRYCHPEKYAEIERQKRIELDNKIAERKASERAVRYQRKPHKPQDEMKCTVKDAIPIPPDTRPQTPGVAESYISAMRRIAGCGRRRPPS